MKELYSSPVSDVQEFSKVDIMTASDVTTTTGIDQGDGGWD